MKALIAVAIMLVLCVAAQAKPAPVDPRGPSAVADIHDDSALSPAIYMGPSGAMLEAGYFRAPPTPLSARGVFPCRAHLYFFDKTRLAQACD